ncbi:MAG: hypothetical protein C0404_14715 [Verrucomicrobia bacterium]|nr:hypothetical protein [Verrucomicrobiota bacterium]
MSERYQQKASQAEETRRVWVWADAHIGLSGPQNDNRDGWEWLESAIIDVRDHLLPLDFVLSLGDLTNKGTDEQLAKYAEVRSRAGFAKWYEMAGNHDYWAFLRGSWQKHASLPQHAVLVDGNVVWILSSVELDGASGRISQKTFDWLKKTIDLHRDKNVIVCTHQPLYDTVTNSKKEWRSVFVWKDDGHPYEIGRVTEDQLRAVERMLDEVRVDLWLCSHAHSGPRDPNWCVRRGRTTILNVASICHAYGTQASRSFLFELENGSNILKARNRHHEKSCFAPEFSLDLQLPFPWKRPQTNDWVVQRGE